MEKRRRSRPRRRQPQGEPASPPAADGGGDPVWRQRRLDALLRRAAKKPSVVLRDRRYHKPHILERFFELCDDQCLRHPKAAAAYARYAVELAKKIGDRHLIHKSRGTLVHAHIAGRSWAAAAEAAENYRVAAFACCRDCAADWLRRRGDLLVETRDLEGAQEAVAEALETLGPDIDPDMHGRIRFIRGIAHHLGEDREQALEDAREALFELSLSSPQGYFLDTLALIACYLQHGKERRHYRLALDALERFRQRFRGRPGWTEVRQRLSWVEGQVRGRLGERKKAGDRLDRVVEALHRKGPERSAMAATIDRSLLYARRVSDTDLRAIRRLMGRCRRLELDPRLQRWVRTVQRVASMRPEKTHYALGMFRYAFIVPVPGLLAEGRLR